MTEKSDNSTTSRSKLTLKLSPKAAVDVTKAAAPKRSTFFSPLNIAASVALIAAAAYIWAPEYSRSMPMAILEQPIPSPSEMDENDMLLSQIEPVLYSVIPSFETEAVRQAILATPLRKNELIAINEEDAVEDETEAVLDKVIVAPKVIAHQEKPVIPAAPAAPTCRSGWPQRPVRFRSRHPSDSTETARE